MNEVNLQRINRGRPRRG